MMTPMNPDAPVPDPRIVRDYTDSYADEAYLERSNPLTMLRLSAALRVALRAYDESCVHAARQAGASWADIAEATGMARQNAQRKWSHVG